MFGRNLEKVKFHHLKQMQLMDGEMKTKKCSSTVYEIICTIYKLL